MTTSGSQSVFDDDASAPCTTALVDLLTALRAAGFSTAMAEQVLGSAGMNAAAQQAPEAAVWHAEHAPAEVTTLARDIVIAFYLRQPRPAETFTSMLGAPLTKQLITAGVLRSSPSTFPPDSRDRPAPENGALVCAVDIRPISVAAHGARDILIASDPDASMEQTVPGHSHVPGVGHAPLSLLNVTPPISAGSSVLDLGCGSGVLGLVARCSAPGIEVFATDISRRALQFAQVNAQVEASKNSAAPKVTLREGSWFEPVQGQRFDKILANPPFVIGPALVGHVYRDSGLPMDAATELVVSQASQHLTDGGQAHILAGWALGDGDDAAGRIAGWLPSHGIRAWAVQRSLVDVATYVTTWVKDESLDPRSQTGRQRTREWLDFFAAHGVTHIGLGFVHLEKIDADHPTDLTVEDLDRPLPPGTYLGWETQEFFARARWLDMVDADDILDARYAVRPTTALEDIRLPTGDAEVSHGFQRHCLRLTRTDGPAWSHDIDEPVAHILAGLHPHALSLRDVVGLYAAVNEVDECSLLEAVVPIVVDLIRHGIILPAELLDADSLAGSGEGKVSWPAAPRAGAVHEDTPRADQEEQP